MSTYHFVLDRLAIGSCPARNVPGWQAIISVQPMEERINAGYEDASVQHGTALLHVPVNDGEKGLFPWLAVTERFIREHICKGAVLVHCGAGRSRSASVVIAYLVSCGMSIPEAEALVKSRRKSACPYTGFLEEIRQYYGADLLLHAGPTRFGA